MRTYYEDVAIVAPSKSTGGVSFVVLKRPIIVLSSGAVVVHLEYLTHMVVSNVDAAVIIMSVYDSDFLCVLALFSPLGHGFCSLFFLEHLKRIRRYITRRDRG